MRTDAGWYVAGALFLILVVGVTAWVTRVSSSVGGEAASAPPFASGATSTGSMPPDLSQMTPREAADRLFNRVMTAAAQGNSAEADQFLPMALDAYELARPLTEDGLFHLSLLQRANGDPDAAFATALEGFDANPDHLLLLYTAAKASTTLGDESAGREYYQRLLDAWDAEMAAGRVEYDQEHRLLMPTIRSEAEAYLSGSGGASGGGS